MKAILLEEYGGAVATAALVQVTKSGKVLNNIPHLDLWTEGAVIAADIFASEHMGEIGQGLLNGAGLAAAALFTQTMIDRFLLPSATSTASTSASSSQPSTTVFYSSGSASTGTAASSTTTAPASTASDVPSTVA